MESLEGSLKETILHRIERDNKLQGLSHQDVADLEMRMEIVLQSNRQIKQLLSRIEKT